MAVAGVIILIIEMAYVWMLDMRLLKAGDADPTWCPALPSDVPPEVGFSYDVGYFLPSVECSVSSKEAGWEATNSTLLLGSTVTLCVGVALILGGLVWSLVAERHEAVS